MTWVVFVVVFLHIKCISQIKRLIKLILLVIESDFICLHVKMC